MSNSRSGGLSARSIRDSSEDELNTLLRPYERVTRQIRGGESHTFVATVASGQFIHFHVEQLGAPLLAELVDPLGQSLISVDTPAGPFGPIFFSTVTTVEGRYQIRIRSKDKWANLAKYELTLAEVRVPIANDKPLIDAQRLFAKGRERYRATDGKAALGFYAQALTLFELTKDYHWLALTHYALAEQLRIQLQSKTAIEHLENTLGILKQHMHPNDWRLKASALNDLGSLLRDGGQIEPAQTRLNEALSIYASHGDKRGQASTLNNLARVQFSLGNNGLARQLIEQAIPLRVAENDLGGVANLWNALGAISDREGDPALARNYFTKAVEQWNGMTELAPADHARIAAAFNNLAKASDSLGDWDLALKYYDKALGVFPEGHPSRAATLDNKGELLAALGDIPAARRSYDQALGLLSSDTTAPDTKAGVLIHLGQLFLRESRIDEALQEFKRALLLEGLVSARRRAEIHSNLGSVWTQKKEFNRALESYRQALASQVTLDDKRGQALTHKNLAKAYALMNRLSEALKELDTSLALWVRVKDQAAESATLHEIASLERDQGNFQRALQASDSSIQLIELLRTRVSNPDLRTTYFENQQRHYELAIDLRLEMRKRDGSADFVQAAFEKSESARARVLLETLTDVLGLCRPIEQGAFIRQSSFEQCGALEKKLILKRQARTRMLNESHTLQQIETLDREIEAIVESLQSLDASLVSENPNIKSLIHPQPFTSAEIQRQLDPDTVLVEYALGEKRSYAWVVTPSSIKGVELLARNEIEAGANRLVNALTARSRNHEKENPQQRLLRVSKAEADFPAAAAALSKLVIDPIASLLGGKRLVIVADGGLQYVPFSALLSHRTGITAGDASKRNPSDSQSSQSTMVPLISEYEIVTLPSASVLALQRRQIGNRKPAPLSVAILADPVFDADDQRVAKARTSSAGNGGVARKLPAPSSDVQKSQQPVEGSESLNAALRSIGIKNISWLPFSRTEAEAIKKVVPRNETFTAFDFDASRATAASPSLANYKILHIATHGVMDLEHPELSGVILSMVNKQGKPVDGYLRLQEIYNLNLPAELVVLSACQTGVGKQIKGEGLIALTRGFMYAGAKSVVASYWKVDDRATAELMAEFYKQMFVNKQKPAAALRIAQIKISEQKRWNSPHYWAGFFLQGEWN